MAGNKRECVVQRATGYTVMSNYHLRDKNLKLGTKGLLSVILSLPEDWDYTIAGLAVVCGTGKDAVRAAVNELEKAGYITRTQIKAEGGKFGGNQYIIREIPEAVSAPLSGFPTTEKPATEKPLPEKPTEIITEEVITDEDIPPKSPEKPKAERKRGRKAHTTLDDSQMQELVKQNVGTLGDANGWSRDAKNGIYKLVLEFYAPRDTNGAPPKHTARGVNGLFRRMAPGGKCSAGHAQELLLEAIERGWTSVYPREERKVAPIPGVPDDGGGVYKCL